MRRAHRALQPIAALECSHCHELKLPHRVCPHCGYYNGKQILVIKTEE
jgi:large subunit ribosomal protein L32